MTTQAEIDAIHAALYHPETASLTAAEVDDIYVGLHEGPTTRTIGPRRTADEPAVGVELSLLSAESAHADAVVQLAEDGAVWKPVLRTGKWAVGPNGTALNVVAGHSSDPKTAIGLQDILDAHQAGAVEHVTIPTSHEDKVDENTGFIRGLRVEKGPDGVSRLMAAHRFTDKTIHAKVTDGSIANTSVGLEFDYVRKEDGRKFPIVLKHVALTNRPWINGLKPFGVHASEPRRRQSALSAAEVDALYAELHA